MVRFEVLDSIVGLVRGVGVLRVRDAVAGDVVPRSCLVRGSVGPIAVCGTMYAITLRRGAKGLNVFRLSALFVASSLTLSFLLSWIPLRAFEL